MLGLYPWWGGAGCDRPRTQRDWSLVPGQVAARSGSPLLGSAKDLCGRVTGSLVRVGSGEALDKLTSTVRPRLGCHHEFCHAPLALGGWH